MFDYFLLLRLFYLAIDSFESPDLIEKLQYINPVTLSMKIHK